MTESLNLLAVSAWCPYPADNGSRLRAYHLLRQLSRQGHRLTLIALGQGDSDLGGAQAPLEAICRGGARLFPSRFFRANTPKAWLGFFARRPRSLLDTYQPKAAAAIARACRSPEYDAVLALELGIAHYVPPDAAAPCLLDQVEVSSVLKAVREASSARQRLRLGLMGLKYRAHVRSLAPRFGAWTVVSEPERAAVRALLGPGDRVPIHVLPNGVDLEQNAYRPEEGYDPDRLVYNGALSFGQNLEAVRFFAAEALPRVRQARPGARLWVTGRNDVLAAGDPLRRDPGVVLTGYLDDVRPAVRGAAACVVPLRQGGGTRLKILEAMALGTPVVATARGAEGIEAVSGEDLLIADDAEALADSALRLMGDPALRARVGAAGRRVVEARYGWEALGAQLGESLRALARAAGRTGTCQEYAATE